MWLPHKLELQMKIFDKLPEVGFIYTYFSCFSDKEGILAASYIREYFHIFNQYKLNFDYMFQNKTTLGSLGFPVLFENATLYWGDISNKVILGPMFPTPTIVLKKVCIENVGLFDEEYSNGEDFEFHARIAKQYKVAYVDVPMLKYRRFHLDQLSSERMEIATNLNWLEITKKIGITDHGYYETNKRIVDLRISHCYYGIGLAFYKNGKNKEALDNFIKSLRMNCKQRKIYLYTVMALFGTLIQNLIKTVFRPRVNNG